MAIICFNFLPSFNNKHFLVNKLIFILFLHQSGYETLVWINVLGNFGSIYHAKVDNLS